MTKDEIQAALDAVNEWVKICNPYPAEYPVNMRLDVQTSIDTINIIREALQSALDGAGVPNGYVLVPKDKVPPKKQVALFLHNKEDKTVTLDERTYRDLNECAVLLHKYMDSAPQVNSEGADLIVLKEWVDETFTDDCFKDGQNMFADLIDHIAQNYNITRKVQS